MWGSRFPDARYTAVWEKYIRAAHVLGMDVEDLWETMGGDKHASENWHLLQARLEDILQPEPEPKPKGLTPRQMAWARQQCRRKISSKE